MADNVAITAGTGTTVHADEYTHSTLGSGKTQLVKLVDGTLDSSTAIAAGGGVEAGALRVTLASDSTGVVSVDDNGGALTVDGSVTANAGTNLNTSALALEAGGNLAAIKAKTDNIPALGQAIAAASVPVILPSDTITTLTPPAAITGFATSAKQDTIIGHVDGLEVLAGTIDADTSNISTKIDTLAGAVAGTEIQVDVLTMPTTTVTATDLDVRPLVNTDVVTAELSAVDNAVLDTIAAKDFATQTTLAVMNAKMVTGTDIGDVTINNSTGASAVNIQDGGNTITVDGTVAVTNSDITSIKTAVETIDNAISGSEMQVDVVGALPAGTNAIGKLAANSGVDIGDVTLTAGTAAIGLLLPPDTDVTAHTNYARKYYTNAGAVTDGIIWSPAAGKRWHVVTMYLQTSAAATITLEDDKAGGDDPVWKAELAANSGVVLSFTEKYPMASGEDAADLIITTTAGNVYVTAVGYEI